MSYDSYDPLNISLLSSIQGDTSDQTKNNLKTLSSTSNYNSLNPKVTVIMKLYDGMSAHTMAVRLFILERGGLTLDVETIDMITLQNRGPAFRKINPRGEMPALELDDGTILTEIPAICEYLDEMATSGHSLFGSNPQERAETRMWLRRMDLEIAGVLISWYRNDPDTVDFYLGNRIPIPEARVIQKVQVNQGLNRLEEELEGKQWLCGDRFSAADIHFYGLVKLLTFESAPWVLAPGRKNVCAYFKRMAEREASVKALELFSDKVEV